MKQKKDPMEPSKEMILTGVANLEQDKEILLIKKATADLVARAENFRVDSDEKENDASEVCAWISDKFSIVEARRKFYKTPYSDIVKKIDGFAKEITSIMDKADAIMRGKILKYRGEKERKRLEEEEKIRKDAEKLSKKTGVPVNEIVESNKPEELSNTAGQMSVKKPWKCTGFTDIKKVDPKFLMLNMVEINRAIRDGMHESPGLKIEQVETLSL